MFRAVVLAGERPGGSALKRELGLAAGVLADVAGKSALQRVIDALEGAQQVRGGILCGPADEIYRANPEFERILSGTGFTWLAPKAGPSASAIHAVQTIDSYPALLTAGDHALLNSDLVDSFCRSAQTIGGDVVVGLAPHAVVHAAYPESRRTVQRYRDGAFCGTNLFAVMNPQGLAALNFWQDVEAQRKRPWKIARKLGFGFMLHYLLRRVTLHAAFRRLSVISGCQVTYVLIDSARAAVDVDSVADRDLAEKILRAESGG
jgi:GTP:adenosylcobinamide-phosphate guanylyltransferase